MPTKYIEITKIAEIPVTLDEIVEEVLKTNNTFRTSNPEDAWDSAMEDWLREDFDITEEEFDEIKKRYFERYESFKKKYDI